MDITFIIYAWQVIESLEYEGFNLGKNKFWVMMYKVRNSFLGSSWVFTLRKSWKTVAHLV
jgi:hypothetical protein